MYRLSDSERANELDMQINMLLAQSENIDNPYTASEYRAIIHQIDRLTIKRDLLYDRANLQREKEENKENKKYSILEYIILILIYIIYIIFLKIMISL